MRHMNKKLQKNLYTIVFVCVSLGAFAQGQQADKYLYVSKQTGEFCQFQGGQGKTTDKYEHGGVTNVVVDGPIQYQVNPADMTIGINQTKNWQGKVWPILAQCPAPGNSVWSKLIAHYDVTYSRPQGVGMGGNVQSTYECGAGSIDDGCAFHGPAGGTHEIINKIGTEEQPFEVFSINCVIPAAFTCQNGTATLHADIYPGNGGDVTWQTPFGQLQGNDITVNLPANFNNIPVTATYTVCGCSYTAQGVIRPNNFTGFGLPCCVSGTQVVANIAVLQFDGPCWPPVVFSQAAVAPMPDMMTAAHTVTAISNGVPFVASTVAVAENNTWTYTPLAVDFTKLGKIVETIADAVKSVSGSPFSPSVNVTGQINIGSGKICCPGLPNCVQNADKIEGQVGVGASLSCRFPVYGIPYVASLDALLDVGVNASVGANITTTCTDPKACITGAASLTLGLGLGLSLAGGLVTADLRAVVEGAGVELQYCFLPAPATAAYTVTLGKIKIVGSVTTLEIFNYSVEYVLFEGWQSGPHPINL